MIPAAFTAFTGKDHWQILLQARAIENTAYVVAPAQTGIHYGRRQSHGHAMVIDPWGTVLSDAGKTQGAAIAPADKESCLLYTSPSPRDLSTSRMPSSA